LNKLFVVIISLIFSFPLKLKSSDLIIDQIQKSMDQEEYKKALELSNKIEGNLLLIYKIKAFAYMGLNKYKESIEFFQKAMVLDEEKTKDLRPYLCQSFSLNKQIKKALTCISKIKDGPIFKKEVLILKARILVAADHLNEAYDLLSYGVKKRPLDWQINLEYFHFLAKKKLSNQLINHLNENFKNLEKNLNEKKALNLTRILMMTGTAKKAFLMVKRLSLMYPKSHEILASLAFLKAKLKLYRSAAKTYQKAFNLSFGKYAFETAEQFLSAKLYKKALRFNSIVKEKQKRFNQRLRILIRAKKYYQALSLGKKKGKNYKPKDSSLYLLAFANYKTDNLAQLKSSLGQIKSEIFLEKAKNLIENLEESQVRRKK